MPNLQKGTIDKYLLETAFHKVYKVSSHYITHKMCNFLRESGDFLHSRRRSGLYWLHFTVFERFGMFTVNKMSHRFSAKSV